MGIHQATEEDSKDLFTTVYTTTTLYQKRYLPNLQDHKIYLD